MPLVRRATVCLAGEPGAWEAFEAALLKSFTAVEQTFARIDVEKAEAGSPEDQAMILDAARESEGVPPVEVSPRPVMVGCGQASALSTVQVVGSVVASGGGIFRAMWVSRSRPHSDCSQISSTSRSLVDTGDSFAIVEKGALTSTQECSEDSMAANLDAIAHRYKVLTLKPGAGYDPLVRTAERIGVGR